MLKKNYYWLHKFISKPEEKSEYSSGYWSGRIREKALILFRGLSGRILDIGCGEGLFLVQLANQNPNLQIWGIDNDSQRLRQAQEKAKEKNLQNINLFLQEATGLNFSDEYFDAVVCINTIHNLESIDIVRKVLCEMARVCKKKGRVVFEFRNIANPLLYFKYKLAPLYDQTVKELPLKSYGLGDMRLLLDEAGLNIINKICIGFPLKSMAPVIMLETEKI